MKKKLTLEERISRLERLMKIHTPKNEFLGVFNKPKRSDEKDWVMKFTYPLSGFFIKAYNI